jgi:hypothetical protein
MTRPVQANPQDRYSPGYAAAWAAWVAAFAIIEAKAVHDDSLHPADHVKRTLSSTMRRVCAWDTHTDHPLAVPFGKLRRLSFLTGMAWFPWHITKPGSV